MNKWQKNQKNAKNVLKKLRKGDTLAMLNCDRIHKVSGWRAETLCPFKSWIRERDDFYRDQISSFQQSKCGREDQVFSLQVLG